MCYARFFLVPIFCLLSFYAIAQETKYSQSEPLDLLPTGWNKVLCMKNGSTMLFHLEPKKNIEVFVFDSTCKLIANSKDLYRYLDVLNLENSVFEGLFEVNGEAVLFMQQERFSKHTLIRARYNSTTGKLVDEKIAGESPSLAKRTRFYTMKNKNDSSYAILFSTDNPNFKDCDVHITYYVIVLIVF